jgi:hypothetical protein
MTDTAAPDIAPARPENPFPETDDARTQAMEASMTARGESTVEPIEVDYFAFDETHVLILPDGKQKIFHKALTEGDRRKYLRASNRDVKLQRATGDAYLKMAPGEDRASLLKSAITGWELTKGGKPFLFTPKALDDMLEQFPPKIIDLIHKDILRVNPWLLGEMTVEDIDREIATLQEQRQTIIEEAAGKGSL